MRLHTAALAAVLVLALTGCSTALPGEPAEDPVTWGELATWLRVNLTDILTACVGWTATMESTPEADSALGLEADRAWLAQYGLTPEDEVRTVPQLPFMADPGELGECVDSGALERALIERLEGDARLRHLAGRARVVALLLRRLILLAELLI